MSKKSPKTYLVARREYLDNLRTKTFWIGILAFPVILSASIVLPRWLDKKKDARTYAVIDHSAWLHAEVKEKANRADLLKIIRDYREDAKKGKSLEKYPPIVGQMMTGLEEQIGDDEEAQDQLLRLALSKQEDFENWLATAKKEKQEIPEFAEQAYEAIKKKDAELKAWCDQLDPEEAAKYRSSLDRARYKFVEYENATEDDLREKVDRDELFAYFVIGEKPIESSEGCKYISNNLTDESLRNWYSRNASSIVTARRFEKEQVDPDLAAKIQEPLKFSEKKVTATGEEKKVEDLDTARQWAPMAFVYLLWISVFTSAQLLLTNTVEEKSNRTIEVLLSSVSPVQLMNGKILGIAATGLTVVGSWAVFFLAGVKLAPKFMGFKADFLDQVAQDPVFLASFLIYFLLGFLLYAAILVGLGSVCNSLKEAQNLMQPLFILLIVPIVAMFPITRDPNGALAKFLTYIPFFTPFVMMNRTAGPPSLFEYVVSTALLLAFIVLTFWSAAKVFRIGILMTGKPPKITEIIRWIRVPVGTVPDAKHALDEK